MTIEILGYSFVWLCIIFLVTKLLTGKKLNKLDRIYLAIVLILFWILIGVSVLKTNYDYTIKTVIGDHVMEKRYLK